MTTTGTGDDEPEFSARSFNLLNQNWIGVTPKRKGKFGLGGSVSDKTLYELLSDYEEEVAAPWENPDASNIGRRPSATIEKLRNAIEDLGSQARAAAEFHSRRARTWERLHLWFGLPGAIMAAVAGTTALVSTSGRITAGILALGAAALAAGSTFLDAESKAMQAKRCAAALSTVATDAQILATHIVEDKGGQVRRSLRSLVDRLEAIHVGDLAAAEVLKALERNEPDS